MSRDLAAHDCVAQALSRLPAYLQRQRWRELVEVIASEIQEADDALVAVTAQLHLDRAEGAMLDAIGNEVREGRGGRSDADYRRGIAIRVATNRSRATAEDVIRVARTVLDSTAYTVELSTTGPATAAMAITGTAGLTGTEADRLTGYARIAVAASVRLLVETSEVADSDAFRFAPEGSLPRVIEPPDAFAAAWQPDFRVVENADGSFSIDQLDELALRVPTARTVYVDQDHPSASDAAGNDGTDPDVPFKSLHVALNRWGVAQTIYVKAGWYPVSRSWSGGIPWGADAHVNVIGVTDFDTLAPGVVVSSVSEEVTALTWTNLGGGVWSAPLASAPYAVVDLAGGSPTWFTSQAVAGDVNTPGEYHHGAAILTVATLTGGAPGSSLRVLRNDVFNGRVASALDVTIENVHFEGGGFLRSFWAQDCRTLVLRDCQATLSEFNGFDLNTAAVGALHTVLHLRSVAKWNTGDGITYTATGAGTSVRGLELDCVARENGRTAGSNQGSTGHRAAANPYVAILRKGGDYRHNEAQEATDVGCLTWMVACTLNGTDSVGTGYEMADDGQAWLHACSIGGVVNDLATNAAAGVINVYDTAYATTTGPGTVQAYTPSTYAIENAGGKGFAGAAPVVDLGPLCGGSGYDAVVGVRDWGASANGVGYTLAFLSDVGAPAAGVLAEGGIPDLEFTFQPGTTTVADFEAAVAASTWLFIDTAGTVPGSTVLADTFTAAFGGAAGSSGGALARVQE